MMEYTHSKQLLSHDVESSTAAPTGSLFEVPKDLMVTIYGNLDVQWTSPFGKLKCLLLLSIRHHHPGLNVASQHRIPTSLFCWL